MNGTVSKKISERAIVALNNAFLRNAVKFTTEKLRTQKRAATEELGNWDIWRERAQQIRTHTIAHLDYYLEQFIDKARAAGTQIHFAETAEEAVRITMQIAATKSAKSVVKSKSMLSEELHINEALQEQGIEAVETDLGEYIIQLAGETPSHLIIPAIHKNKQQVADLFSEVAGTRLPAETSELAGFARATLREKFLQADIGLTGCNFAVAETGSMVLFSNEGNARMVTTVPKTQITYMGMERIVPTLDDLEVMAAVLPRSATGQKLTAYMSVITGPRRTGDQDGPEEMHIIIVDNGRSEQLGDPEFQDVLNCIRCGACLNVCPVYRQVGGHTYDSVYSGPIGAVLTPLLHQNEESAVELASASTLCGACSDACPVKIPLHDMLVHVRHRGVQNGFVSPAEKLAFQAFGYATSHHKRYQRLVKLGQFGQKLFVQDGVSKVKIGALKGWNAHRLVPALAKQTFRESWHELQKDMKSDAVEMSEDLRQRMEQILAKRGK
ncbi:MAG: LutB/LldF family L-lactate oxidation iron-sulfur protein [Tumebacillaceae bacterium]